MASEDAPDGTGSRRVWRKKNGAARQIGGTEDGEESSASRRAEAQAKALEKKIQGAPQRAAALIAELRGVPSLCRLALTPRPSGPLS